MTTTFRPRFDPARGRFRLMSGVLAALALAGPASAAEPWPAEYRLQHATGKLGDTTSALVAFRLHSPRALRAHHLELAAGTLASSDEAGAVVSVGPVWRFPLAAGRTYVDFGFSPTLISNTEVDGRDMGGHFHFTSSLSFGATFGSSDQYSIALRAQHTSNGGLNEDNPGLDMVGLNFSIGFRD